MCSRLLDWTSAAESFVKGGSSSQIRELKESGQGVSELEREALKYDLHLLQAQVKHLGTENNMNILKALYEDLKSQVTFAFGAAVETIAQEGEGFALTLAGGETETCRYLIGAPGRSGAEWFANQCKAWGWSC